MPKPDWQEICYKSVQYFHTDNQWREISVTWNRVQDAAGITIKTPSDAEPALMGQLKNVQGKHTLADMVTANCWWEIDIKSQNIFISRRLAKTLLLAEDAAVIPLSRFLDTVHPEDLGNFAAALYSVDTMESSVYSRSVRRDGSQISFNSFAVGKYNDQGEMVRIVGCSHNMSDRLDCQNELDDCLNHFGLITQNAPVVYLAGDMSGRCGYISPNSKAIIGIDSLADNRIDFSPIHNEDRERVRVEAAGILYQNTAGIIRCRIKVANGDYHWFMIHLQTVPDTKREPIQFIAFIQDIAKEMDWKQHSSYLRIHDPLTNVYNRAYFLEETQRLQQEENVRLCLVLVDVNGLNLINHSLGNEKGDEALVEVAQILRNSFSGNHMISRIGGGEFGVFVYDTDQENVERMCARIENACRQTQRRMIPLSISWGIAERRDKTMNMNEVFTLAEKRLYWHKTLERSSLHSQTILALKQALRSRNLETAEHMQRIGNLVVKLGRLFELESSEIDRLILLASLHDIGKMAIPDRILNKPGRLTDKEMEIMKTHCREGSRIAGASHVLSAIANEILCHHERWDGTGYPVGLKGEGIPLLSRMISVVDAYDVMTSKRVYKEAMSHEAAVQELRRCEGTQFDPDIVERFIRILETNRA